MERGKPWKVSFLEEFSHRNMCKRPVKMYSERAAGSCGAGFPVFPYTVVSVTKPSLTWLLLFIPVHKRNLSGHPIRDKYSTVSFRLYLWVARYHRVSLLSRGLSGNLAWAVWALGRKGMWRPSSGQARFLSCGSTQFWSPSFWKEGEGHLHFLTPLLWPSGSRPDESCHILAHRGRQGQAQPWCWGQCPFLSISYLRGLLAPQKTQVY